MATSGRWRPTPGARGDTAGGLGAQGGLTTALSGVKCPDRGRDDRLWEGDPTRSTKARCCPRCWPARCSSLPARQVVASGAAPDGAGVHPGAPDGAAGSKGASALPRPNLPGPLRRGAAVRLCRRAPSGHQIGAPTPLAEGHLEPWSRRSRRWHPRFARKPSDLGALPGLREGEAKGPLAPTTGGLSRWRGPRSRPYRRCWSRRSAAGDRWV